MKEEIIQARLTLARETNELDLSDISELDEIPADLFSQKSLKKLNLEGHHIQYLPEDLFKLEALEELNLAGDVAAPGLQRLPDKISHLKNLRKLNLSRNALQHLPLTICHLSQLEILSLNDNRLRELPEDISCLVELKELFLSGNQLHALPDSIGKLKGLKGLYLQHNRLKYLPSTIGNLDQLERLNLNHNKLLDIPLTLRTLRCLKLFDLRHNPLLADEMRNKYPAEIYAQFRFPSVILRDLEIRHEDLDENKEPLAEAKLILLGDGNVGKTTLVNQLVPNEDEKPEGTTKGVNITPWAALENGSLRLNIWDFAGQAIMHATHQLFLTENSIYLVVLNARQEVQEERLLYWLNVIMSFAGDKATIIVVINGIDQNRLYLDQRGLKKTYGIRDFIETSATERIGIKTLQSRVIDLAKELPTVQKRVKLSWKAARRLVEKHIGSLTLESMSWNEFEKICESRRIANQQDQDTLLDILHEIGVIFSPKEHGSDKGGGKPSILNPDQLTKSIYELQSSEETLKAQRDDGRVSPDELRNILADIEMTIADWNLLKPIMERHDLCIELNNRNLVFTRLLPVEEPPLSLTVGNQTTRFTYKFNFLPESVLPRFIGALSRSKLSESIFFEELWHRGVHLQIEASQLLMRIEPGSKRLDLTIFSDDAVQRKQLLEQVRYILSQVYDQIPYLKAEQLVPVTNENGDEQLIPFAHLVNLENMGYEKFIPYGWKEAKDVRVLLDSIEHKRMERHKLRELVEATFSLSELRNLCHDLDVDHENLPHHETRAELSRELIQFMVRHGRIEELVFKCQQERPNYQWPVW